MKEKKSAKYKMLVTSPKQLVHASLLGLDDLKERFNRWGEIRAAKEHSFFSERDRQALQRIRAALATLGSDAEHSSQEMPLTERVEKMVRHEEPTSTDQLGGGDALKPPSADTSKNYI